ncbi:MAG: glycine cleavage system protein GcvH [Verrucomicrobia bacterium]|nr:MAG: glycine cleavage system protein GcvH [Verrucomicrobiota bacterium]
MNVPANLLYTREHEWVRKVDDNTVVVGITDYAQESLGDVTYVELPAVGDAVEKGATFGVVESVKAASDLYAPVSGEVVEINETLTDAPETVNSDPYEAAWMITIRLDNPAELDELLSPEAYEKHIADQA